MHEAIEEIDANQVEAITATGASRGQVLVYGIWPQIVLAWPQVTLIFLVILASVIASDWISARVPHAFI
jgi:phosphonate transport system permease protein